MSKPGTVVLFVVFSSCGMMPTMGAGGGQATAGGTAASGGGSGGGAGMVRNDVISGTRLKAVVMKSADGALAPVSATLPVFWDSQLETYCSPGNTADEKMRCVPQTSSSVAYFSDAACTHRLLASLGSRPPLPAAKVQFAPAPFADGGCCGAKYFEQGAAYTGQVFTLYSGRCSNQQFDPGPFVEAGAEVDVSRFAEFTFAIDQ